ncbi:unnamed protein product [Cylicocyclus nassatus]|uniref:Serum response factor-binding protein 1 n=1 Tax=Cylicocyclus nassatus TaxID=53992 RepID=A0AA36GLN1_CYLNA|nr:unnamed protein product [Cylicocyclus nassatus]
MVKRKSSQREDDELMLNRPVDDREEEEYDVADLSAIPAPKIEFVMPNLTPLEGAKKQPLKKKTSKASSPPSSSSGESLTSEQLNIEIVHLRPTVQKAQRFLVQRLVRKMKRLEKLLEEKETDAVKRKVARYEEEIHFVKKIKKDEVSKFALLNKKTLDLLQITDKTPVKDRCIFKLACEPPMVKAIESFRSRYPSWEVTTAFLLQRLGLQYSSAKDEKWPLAGSEGEESDGSRSDSEESEEDSPMKAQPKIQAKKKLTKDSFSETPSKAEPTKQLKRKRVRRGSEVSEDTKGEKIVAIGPATDNADKPGAESGSSEKSSPVKETVLKKKKSVSLPSPAKPTLVKKKKSLPSQSLADKTTSPKKKKSLGVNSEKSGEGAGIPSESHKLAVVKKITLGGTGEIKLDKRPAPSIHQQKHTTENIEQDNFFMPVSASTSNNDVKRRQDEIAVTTEKKKNRLSEENKHFSYKSGVNKKSIGKTRPKSFSSNDLSHPKLAKKQETPEDLHPSWAARRLAKERQLSAPQGKRIVFEK